MGEVLAPGGLPACRRLLFPFCTQAIGGSPVLRAFSKLEFVTSDQVFTFFVVYCLLYPLENKSFVPDLFKTIFRYRFYLLIS